MGAADADGGRAARVTARRVVRTALVIYRRRAVTLAVISLAVFSLLAVAETLVELVIARRADSGGNVLVEAELWVVSGLWMFGAALFAGMCDTIVAAELGHDEPPLVQAWRSLPFARLLALDLVVTVVVTVGMAAFVIPGLILFTLTCLAAPLIVLEHRGVQGSLVRSSGLVRPRLALTFLIVTLPVLLEHEVIHAIEAVAGLGFLPLLLLNLAGAVFVLAPVTLCEIVLAHALTTGRIEPVPPRR